jgi:hypothetical protein
MIVRIAKIAMIGIDAGNYPRGRDQREAPA